MVLQPLGDRLIVEVLEEEELTASGIVLPDVAREKPQRGRVVAVGPGARGTDGKRIEVDVAQEDEVVFSKYGGTEIKLGADGARSFADFINLRTIAGMGAYGISTILWIFTLAKLPLSRVYAFTVLTFLLVYLASFVLLGEPLRAPVIIGATLVLSGLVVITVG